jgi:hypothetical protein
MQPRPSVAPYDEIYVGTTRCVVSLVREPGHSFGDCEVVFNPDKPTNHDVVWGDGKWEFPERGDFGGYAERNDRLRPFVAKLRGGG